MKLKDMVKETFECVKINGILRNLTNDEMRIYKKVKDEGKLFKADLSEFDANVATSMVSKGLLRRKKAQQENGKHGRLYFVTRGRKGHLATKMLDEVAPPSKKSESWIKKNKKRFKDKYGKNYGKYLYGKAWNDYNGKVNESYSPLTESFDEDEIKDSEVTFVNKYGRTKEEIVSYFRQIMDILINSRISDSNKVSELADINALSFNEERYDCVLFSGQKGVISSIVEEMWEKMRDVAYEDGSWNVYNDGELDSEKTWEKISDESYSTLIDSYMSFRDVEQFVKELIECTQDVIPEVKEILNNYKQDSTQFWDGSEEGSIKDNPQTKEKIQQTNELLNKLTEFLSFLQEKQTSSYNEEDISEVLEKRNDMENEAWGILRSYSSRLESIFDSFREDFERAAYDSGDYNEYEEQELDVDGTLDEISNRSFSELYRGCSGVSDVDDILFGNYKLAIDHALNTLSKDSSAMPSGEEFNESVLYESEDKQYLHLEDALDNVKVEFNEKNESKKEKAIDTLTQIKIILDDCLHGSKNYTKCFEKLFNDELLDVSQYNTENMLFDGQNKLFTIEHDILEKLLDAAYDSGDYNVYRDQELDYSSTRESITGNFSPGEIIYIGVSPSDINDFLYIIRDKCEGIYKALQNYVRENNINQWDGSEDTENTTITNIDGSLTQEYNDIITICNKADNSSYDSDDLNKIISLVENFLTEVGQIGNLRERTKPVLNNIQNDYEDLESDGIDTYINNGDYNEYYEQEVDTDETYNAIHDQGYYDLYKVYGLNREDRLLDKLNKYVSTALKYLLDGNGISEIPSGEEFDESVNPWRYYL